MHDLNRVTVMAVLALIATATASAALAADVMTGEKANRSKATIQPLADLPRGFADLKKIAPDIIVEMHYATARNFTGRRVTGYRANRCILARPVAKALARVQARVSQRGFAVKVYDCYRPARAVAAFVRWAEGKFGRQDTKFYYPRIARSRVIPLGYISKRSSHSRGTAIDLTLVRTSSAADQTPSSTESNGKAPVSCIAAPPEAAPASLDMGTSWDCFDVLSHTRHGGISAAAKANRQHLLVAMQAEGFRNYKREWWHFSMPLRGYTRMRDFPVK